MRRSKLLDPPEYVDWVAEPGIVAEYRATLQGHPARREIVQGLGQDELLALYAGLVRNRLHDQTLKRWVRQGVISKAWLGTG